MESRLRVSIDELPLLLQQIKAGGALGQIVPKEGEAGASVTEEEDETE